jgi:putative DNA primase/helicase
MTFDELKSLTANQWPDIHRALGINIKSTSPLKHTSCPGCGGKDRFRVTQRYSETGGWICSQGGDTTGGDGFSLLGHVLGYSPADQLKAVAEHLGIEYSGKIDSEAAKERMKQAKQQAAIAAKIDREQRAERLHNAVNRAKDYMLKGRRADHNHPYLKSKGLSVPYNLLQVGSRLIIIIRNIRGEVTGAQIIFGETEVWTNIEWNLGDKFILPGSGKDSGLHWLQLPPDDDNPIAIVEGWATGASLWEPEINHKGAVAVTFDAYNISKVTELLLERYPGKKIIVYADDDKAGIKGAERAVALDSERVSYKLPDWYQVGEKHGNDFNDWLALKRG